MKSVGTISEMRHVMAGARAKGKSVAFGPTRGALHGGHLPPIDEGKAVADLLVMSIFVNPIQFGPSEDFARYPRTLDEDSILAKKRGVDFLFTPTKEDVYQENVPVLMGTRGRLER